MGWQWRALIKLWVTADKFCNLRLQNEAIDSMIRLAEDRKLPRSSLVKLAWDSTVADATLLRLMFDSFVGLRPDRDFMCEHWDELSSDFLRDFFAEMLGVVRDGTVGKYLEPHVRAKCYYHSHNDDCPVCPASPGPQVIDMSVSVGH